MTQCKQNFCKERIRGIRGCEKTLWTVSNLHSSSCKVYRETSSVNTTIIDPQKGDTQTNNGKQNSLDQNINDLKFLEKKTQSVMYEEK